MTPARMPPPVPNRRTFAVLVLGAVVFTVWGSLVPFQYRARSWDDVINSFAWAMANRLVPQSRADAVANVLLGVPLGFGLLGVVCLDRLGPSAAVGRGVLLLPACLGFAAAVEFVQIYFPARTCAASDVLCQGVGAAIGMAAWALFGQRLTDQARAVWTGSGMVNPVGRLLVWYLVLLAFIQVLPMDLSPSPKELYKKLRDAAVFVPFAEYIGANHDQAWGQTAKLLKLAGLYLPVGLLAAGLPGPFWRPGNWPRVAAAALVLAAGMEGLQVAVHSRVPSATDVLVGAAGAVVGWRLRWMQAGGVSVGDALGLGSAWLLMLGAISWEPFPFRYNHPPLPFDWVPGLPLSDGDPLNALEEMMIKLALFALGGAVVGAVRLDMSRRTRWVAAVALGLLVSGVFEAGQTLWGSHTPCVTDVLLGGLGALAGAWVADRSRDASLAAGTGLDGTGRSGNTTLP